MANTKLIHTKSNTQLLAVESGFSLLEAIIAITMFATLTLIAVPSFASIVGKTKVNVATKAMLDSLATARSASLSHGAVVLICQLSYTQPGKCVETPKRNANWAATGWKVYLDLNQNNVYDELDQTLSSKEALNDISLVFNQSGRLRFFANGSARSAGFLVCGKNSRLATHLKILHSGRTRVTKLTSKKNLEKCMTGIKSH